MELAVEASPHAVHFEEIPDAAEKTAAARRKTSAQKLGGGDLSMLLGVLFFMWASTRPGHLREAWNIPNSELAGPADILAKMLNRAPSKVTNIMINCLDPISLVMGLYAVVQGANERERVLHANAMELHAAQSGGGGIGPGQSAPPSAENVGAENRTFAQGSNQDTSGFPDVGLVPRDAGLPYAAA